MLSTHHSYPQYVPHFYIVTNISDLAVAAACGLGLRLATNPQATAYATRSAVLARGSRVSSSLAGVE